MRGTPPTDKEKRGGLGCFVKILSGYGADERVVNSISQLAKLHRNPTMHPEQFIDKTEVLGTFGMATSVIQGIIADMENWQQEPSESITSVLPAPKDLEDEIARETDEDEPIEPLQLSDGHNTPS